MLKFTIAAVCGLAIMSSSAMAKDHIVSQKRLKFVKSSLTLKSGDTVIFKNSDRTAHHIMTKDNGADLSSPLTPPGKAFLHTFKTAGVYNMGCHIHPKMKMTITVK